MSETKHRGGGAAARILMPVVATVASAVASYLAKKAPQYLEQTVMPKLRETKEAAGGAVVGGEDGDPAQPRSNDDLERRRRDRAEHRAARRKAS